MPRLFGPRLRHRRRSQPQHSTSLFRGSASAFTQSNSRPGLGILVLQSSSEIALSPEWMRATSALLSRWNALIRTHHITSRKKVAKLRQAAAAEDVYALLHRGRPPGIMYVEGERAGVEAWLSTVQRLRYKDFQLASRPSVIERDTNAMDPSDDRQQGGLFEVVAVKDFATEMEKRKVYVWWRKAMGYTGSEDRL